MLDSCHEYQIRISVRTSGNKDQSGLSHRLHYRETFSPPPAGGAQRTNSGLLAAISWHWLRLACSGWPAGFESTCVWSSKLKCERESRSYLVRFSVSIERLGYPVSDIEIGLAYHLLCRSRSRCWNIVSKVGLCRRDKYLTMALGRGVVPEYWQGHYQTKLLLSAWNNWNWNWNWNC